MLLTKSNLYMYASMVCFVAFITAIKFLIDPLFGWSPKHSFKNLSYGTYPIVILGFLSLAKSLEYFEMSIYNN
tara:strand:- start:646 stop:864 length:219 start_codon:yes stop_codon:yes gene_type:complete